MFKVLCCLVQKCDMHWFEHVLLPGSFTVKILKFWSPRNCYIYSHSVLMYILYWHLKSEAIITGSRLLNLQLVADVEKQVHASERLL